MIVGVFIVDCLEFWLVQCADGLILLGDLKDKIFKIA